MLREWVDAYVRAWNSNDPNDIGALFTDDVLTLVRVYLVGAVREEPWSPVVDTW